MKNIKFSRLFAAMLFVAVLTLAGCKPNPKKASINRTWKSSYNEEFTISETKAAETAFDMWAMDIKEVFEDDDAGILYGILTKGSEWTPAGDYYAVAYKELSDDAVKISAAATSYKTLEDVKANCGKISDFAYWSECVPKE